MTRFLPSSQGRNIVFRVRHYVRMKDKEEERVLEMRENFIIENVI